METTSKMKSGDLYGLIQSVAKAVTQNLPDIIEPLPVCGQSLSRALTAVRKGIEDYHNQKITLEEYGRIRTELDDAVEKEAAQAEPPVFMDCVIFRCRSGYTLSEEQQGMLADVFAGGEDETGAVADFIDTYMGGMICEGEDYFIGDDYVSLNFLEYDEYPYDGDVLDRLRKVLNGIVGCEAFQYFVADGHDEPHEDYENEEDTIG